MREQKLIVDALGVAPSFDVKREAHRRIEFLGTYLRASGLNAYVLGISGGVDSLAAALLAQRAVDGLRATGYEAKFLAVRLPYGTQADESDAQRALDTIQADEVGRSTSSRPPTRCWIRSSDPARMSVTRDARISCSATSRRVSA